MERLVVPQGTFALHRPDAGPRSPLRAWDAADELVLHHLAEAAPGGGATVVLNDAWGALAVALAAAGGRPTVVTDSLVAGRAVRANLAANDVDPDRVAVASPLDPLPDRVDVVVVRLPKAHALLEHQLHALAPRLHAGTAVVGAAMARHVHRNALDLLERTIGPTRTSRAVRKARLAHVAVDPARRPGPSPWPRRDRIEELDLTVVSHAGTFAAGRVDAGTRLLLSALPDPAAGAHVVDLACGTGIVGTVVGRRHPDARLTFVDESHLAVASAEATWREAHGDRPARVVLGDGLAGPADATAAAADGSVDVVLLNPPFHRDHAQGDATAWRLFAEARAALRPGGELRVVGNRHLAHHARLRRLFGRDAVEVVASDPRYVVVRATRR